MIPTITLIWEGVNCRLMGIIAQLPIRQLFLIIKKFRSIHIRNNVKLVYWIWLLVDSSHFKMCILECGTETSTAQSRFAVYCLKNIVSLFKWTCNSSWPVAGNFWFNFLVFPIIPSLMIRPRYCVCHCNEDIRRLVERDPELEENYAVTMRPPSKNAVKLWRFATSTTQYRFAGFLTRL